MNKLPSRAKHLLLPEVDRRFAGAVFAAPKADPPIDVGMIPRLGGQEGVLGPRARLGEEAA